ncbi:hypothetical protein LguiA_022812 [Lonicera macranthoides]
MIKKAFGQSVGLIPMPKSHFSFFGHLHHPQLQPPSSSTSPSFFEKNAVSGRFEDPPSTEAYLTEKPSTQSRSKLAVLFHLWLNRVLPTPPILATNTASQVRGSTIASDTNCCARWHLGRARGTSWACRLCVNPESAWSSSNLIEPAQFFGIGPKRQCVDPESTQLMGFGVESPVESESSELKE